MDTLLQCLRSISKFEQRAGLNVLAKVVRLFPCFETGHALFVERLSELAEKEDPNGPPSDINVVSN